MSTVQPPTCDRVPSDQRTETDGGWLLLLLLLTPPPHAHTHTLTFLSQICSGLLPRLYRMDKNPLWNVFLNIFSAEELLLNQPPGGHVLLWGGCPSQQLLALRLLTDLVWCRLLTVPMSHTHTNPLCVWFRCRRKRNRCKRIVLEIQEKVLMRVNVELQPPADTITAFVHVLSPPPRNKTRRKKKIK